MVSGIFLMYGSLLSGAFTLFSVITLHLHILQEKIYLNERLGETYRNYKKQRRYLGKKMGSFQLRELPYFVPHPTFPVES